MDFSIGKMGLPLNIKDGEWEWYFNGELHRNGEPAKISWTCEIEYRDWYQHGKLHREDGPARTDGDGNYAYFLDGKELTEENSMHT